MNDPATRATRAHPVTAPLAACGAILAALAFVGLARSVELGAEPATVDPSRQLDPASRNQATPPRAPHSGPDSSQTARLLDGRRIDVNRASVAELQLLPRIGPTLAARIVEERERSGAFRDLADLGRVRGIGPRTLERLAPLATAEPMPDHAAR
jgi:competence protein ComEA